MTELQYAIQKMAEQKARIRQLEREADWLAYNSLIPFYGNSVPIEEVQRLRSEARKEIAND